MKDERPMTKDDIVELINAYTPLADDHDEYLRYLHHRYFELTGEYLED